MSIRLEIFNRLGQVVRVVSKRAQSKVAASTQDRAHGIGCVAVVNMRLSQLVSAYSTEAALMREHLSISILRKPIRRIEMVLPSARPIPCALSSIANVSVALALVWLLWPASRISSQVFTVACGPFSVAREFAFFVCGVIRLVIGDTLVAPFLILTRRRVGLFATNAFRHVSDFEFGSICPVITSAGRTGFPVPSIWRFKVFVASAAPWHNGIIHVTA